jgi:hypothetical protein
MNPDPLSYRLPDIPAAGYSTRLQKELSDALMFFLRGVERDRLLLLEIVIHGREKWRRTFLSAYRAIKADTELADAMWGYLVLLAGPNPDAQKEILQGVERQKQQQTWDKRLTTMLAHSRHTRAVIEAIRKDEARVKRRNPVTFS